MSAYTYIKKLAVPFMLAGIAVGVGSNALAVPAVPTIYDSVTGRTWGLPFSVSLASGTTHGSKLNEITAAGYTAASMADVIAMYQNLYISQSLTFTDFKTAFGIQSNVTSLAFTTTPVGTGFGTVGFLNIGGGIQCVPSLTSCFSVSTAFANGFMYYTVLPTPEPSMIGLFGGMMLSMAWIAHRKLRKD